VSHPSVPLPRGFLPAPLLRPRCPPSSAGSGGKAGCTFPTARSADLRLLPTAICSPKYKNPLPHPLLHLLPSLSQGMSRRRHPDTVRLGEELKLRPQRRPLRKASPLFALLSSCCCINQARNISVSRRRSKQSEGRRFTLASCMEMTLAKQLQLEGWGQQGPGPPAFLEPSVGQGLGRGWCLLH